MSGFARLAATAIVWAAAVSILSFTNIDTSNFINLGVVLLAALFSTAAIWDSAKSDAAKSNHAQHEAKAHEKAKRSADDRLARLIDSLSAEDIARLDEVLESRRAQLDEDEQIELNRLLAEQDRARH